MEINEAFAAQAIAVNRQMGWDTEQGQRQRRRDRARSSDRRLGLPRSGHAAARDAEARCEEGPCVAVHRRRHGRGAGRGTLERENENMGNQAEVVQRAGGLARRHAADGPRIAFVSGGMGGIGTAICRRLGRQGNGDRRLPAGLREEGGVARRMRSEGFACTPPRATSPTSNRARRCSTRSGSEVGPVDILVNNAGITRDSVFKRMTERTGWR